MKKLITCCVLVVFSSLLWSATAPVSFSATNCCTSSTASDGNVALEMLPGDWQKGFVADEPFLSFATDGSYTITGMSEAGFHVKTGRWTLADGGSTLLLHGADGELLAYSIKYLELDELVLSPVNGKTEDWFLNKM